MNKNPFYIFDAWSKNKPGLWYFSPASKIENEKYLANKPCKGFGSIKYPEGSIYIGGLEKTGIEFAKQGQGIQYFSESTMGIPLRYSDICLYAYKGEFNDAKLKGWIEGNGAMYFTSSNKKPLFWTKGFYSSTHKVAEYKGNFDTNDLLEGFTPGTYKKFVCKP